MAAVALIAAALCTPRAVHADPSDSALSGERGGEVSVAVQGERLVARFGFPDLPSEKTWQSILGGIPAAIDISARVHGERSRDLARREERYRVAYDLWEERFDVAWGRDRTRSFETAQELRGFFGRIAGWDLLPVSDLDASLRYRVEVAVVEHRIAPEADEEWGRRIAGGSEAERSRDQRSEVSFSLNSLIRFFYGDAEKQRRPRIASVTFRKGELVVVSDSP